MKISSKKPTLSFKIFLALLILPIVMCILNSLYELLTFNKEAEKTCIDVFGENKELFIKVRDELYDYYNDKYDQTFQEKIKFYQEWGNNLTSEIQLKNGISDYIYEEICKDSSLYNDLNRINQLANVCEISFRFITKENSRYNSPYRLIKFELYNHNESVLSRGIVTSTININDLYVPIKEENDWYEYEHYAI